MIPLSASPTPFLVTWFLHSSVCLGVCWGLERAGLVRSVRAREFLWRTAWFGSLGTALLREAGLPSFALAREPELGLARILSAPTATGLPVPPTLPAPSNSLELVAYALELASLVWAVGTVLGLLRLAGLGLRTAALARRARPAPPALTARWLALCARSARRPARLALSDELSGPVSLPSGSVLVPPWVITELDARQQDALLSHELAHGVRRDAHWQLLSALFAVLLWPQPLARLARRRLQSLAELAADRWAIVAGADGRGLAECLLACASRPRGASILATALDGVGSLSERVERLLTPPAPSSLPHALRLAAWLGLALVGLGAPGCEGSHSRHGSRTSVTLDSNGRTSVSIERNGHSLRLDSDAFELRDDLRGVSALAPDGTFTLTLLENGTRTTYRVESTGGALSETFTRADESLSLDTPARDWIAATLALIGRESSFEPRTRTASDGH